MHCGDLHAHEKRISEMLRREKRLVDHDISGITLTDLHADGTQISGCNLYGVRMKRVTLSHASFQLVFLDSADMEGCDFSAASIQNSVFAGSIFSKCSFADSDLLQCNFMGIRCRGVSFDHSNLYASRFLGGSFENVGMRDCNLTRVRFTAGVSGVDFCSSNTNEASFHGDGR
jgi:fluoroquinolone resistance protein